MALRVDKDSFGTEVTGYAGFAVADFYSDSCIPCKRMSPVIAQLEEENTDVKFVKVNINFDSELAEKYEVRSVPTLVFSKNGEEADRITGAVKKAEIEEKINNLK